MTRLTRGRTLALFGAALAAGGCGGGGQPQVAVGAKNFTEELILGEIYAQVLAGHGLRVARKLNLGGTDIAMEALRRGEIDLYPEYTGTALLTQLKLQPIADGKRIYTLVKAAYERQYALTWLDPAPANNTQALATTGPIAAKYDIRTLSQLAAAAPQLRLGAIPEFLKRSDGLPGLQRTYGGFAFKETHLIDIGLKYKALLIGDVDVVVAFGTDGEIAGDHLVVFVDDKHFWPAYNVAPVVRDQTLKAYPAIATWLNKIAPLLTDTVMRSLNDEVAGTQKREAGDVARDFVKAHALA
ncbi:MAG: glycine betaine ABC transporter substrate-binding protein [Candidatus Velthaea sp.]|jgi:osmoprotectant transport system substrate-binding protein